MVPGWNSYTVWKDEGIGTVKQRHISPPHNNTSFFTQEEGVEAQVVDT